MKFIQIVDTSADGLSEVCWKFWYDERIHALVLDGCARCARATKRHKFMVVSVYSRLYQRTPMPAPTIPEDVSSRAIRQFCDGLTVVVR